MSSTSTGNTTGTAPFVDPNTGDIFINNVKVGNVADKPEDGAGSSGLNINYNLPGGTTGSGLAGLNLGANSGVGVGTNLFGGIPVNAPSFQEVRPTPFEYYSPSFQTLQGIRGLQPEASNLADQFRGGAEEAQPVQMRDGGDPMMYGPRRMGEVPGPLGIERDIIPADLMPGEFVFTKDAVRGAGKMSGGGMKEGVKSMYGLMKKFEGVA